MFLIYKKIFANIDQQSKVFNFFLNLEGIS